MSGRGEGRVGAQTIRSWSCCFPLDPFPLWGARGTRLCPADGGGARKDSTVTWRKEHERFSGEQGTNFFVPSAPRHPGLFVIAFVVCPSDTGLCAHGTSLLETHGNPQDQGRSFKMRPEWHGSSGQWRSGLSGGWETQCTGCHACADWQGDLSKRRD